MPCLMGSICACFFGYCHPRPDEETLSGGVQTETNQNTSRQRADLGDDDDDSHGDDETKVGYEAVVPLPRYTPRPMTISEKTLEVHMQDVSLSSSDYVSDKKSEPFPSAREDVDSDTSSAFSFPSSCSYGNTSTATRETPPPPYSPGPSPPVSRAMSMSEVPDIVPPIAAHIVEPGPFDSLGFLNGDSRPRRRSNGKWPRRLSWASQ